MKSNILLTFGINGSLRKREVQSLSPYTEHYLFNSAANLKAYSNNGIDFAYYGYDAANTRTYKLSMLNLTQWFNGQPQPLQLQLQSAMFYPNAYLTFNQNGNYTKHYYNGSERICSRLGDRTFSLDCSASLTPQTQQRLGIRIMQADQQARAGLLEVVEAGDVPVEFPNVQNLITLLPSGSNSNSNSNPNPNSNPHTNANTSNDIFYYHTNHLGSTAFVTDNNATITQGFLYAPFGEITTEYNASFANGIIPKYAFNAKELDEETGMYYYEARYYKPPVFTSRDAMFEKYFWMTPYAYCANNPVKYVDPSGKETHVAQNEDGTYRVIGGVLNKDRNIYVYTKDKEGNYTIRGKSIGITTSSTSFYNADANKGKGAWAIGSIINPKDRSGDRFLGNIFGNTPTMIDDYMANAGNGRKYDFKVTNGTDKPIEGIDIYRGMPIGETSNGQTIFSSARDIGNIAAGYVAGANGMSWEASRIAFDVYQSKVNRRPNIESISTRNAEMYGWRIGSYIMNNTPTQKANNLLKSLWKWIKQ